MIAVMVGTHKVNIASVKFKVAHPIAIFLYFSVATEYGLIKCNCFLAFIHKVYIRYKICHSLAPLIITTVYTLPISE